MIKTIKPCGAINKVLLASAYERNGRFYIRDVDYNHYEVTKAEYERCQEILKK